MSDHERAGDRESEVLDVELLDVLAQIEALLRHGREIQREALRVRGVPHSVTTAQRQAAAAEIQRRISEMRKECRALGEVLGDLQTAVALDDAPEVVRVGEVRHTGFAEAFA